MLEIDFLFMRSMSEMSYFKVEINSESGTVLDTKRNQHRIATNAGLGSIEEAARTRIDDLEMINEYAAVTSLGKHDMRSWSAHELINNDATSTPPPTSTLLGNNNLFKTNQELLDRCVLVNGSIYFSLECFRYQLAHDLKFLLLALLFLLIIFLDIFSNLVVLVSILIEKSKKRVDLCFASNAIADLTIGLVIMPFTAIYSLFGYFPFNPIVCFIWNVVDFTAGTASMLHIAFISYDRYLSVSKPYKYTQKSNNQRFSVTGIPTYLILIFIWFFALAAWIPAILYFKSRNQTTNTILFDPQKTINLKAQPSTEANMSLTLDHCDLFDPPALIVIPHSFVVYYLPMVLIVVFYSKTISIVNQKVKRRRSSLVSTKYSSTLGPGAHHSNFIYPVANLSQASLRSKKMFNLTGRNKKTGAKILAQHMKTLNMFSVYLLVQPKSGSDGGGGGGGGEAAGDKLTSSSNNNNKSLVADEDDTKPTTSPAAATTTTTATFQNSLSFEIRRVDGEVIMVDDVDDESMNAANLATAAITEESEPVINRDENYLAVEDINLVLNNPTSSSFNSTGSSRLSSTNANEEDTVISLSELKSKQMCVSLDNNSLVTTTAVESVNDERSNFYARRAHNRSLNSNLVKLSQKSSSIGSGSKLRPCSDFGKLDIDEDELTPSPSPVEKDVYMDSIECSSGVKNQSLEKIACTPDESSGNKTITATNGILKHKISIKKNNSPQDNHPARTVSPSASVKMNGAGVNKILSFKISRELEELTTNGIRLASNSNKRERNVTYKLGLIMVTFIVSWLPFSFLWSLRSLKNELELSWVTESLYLFSFWPAYLNSVFTPIILLYSNAKYRRSLFVCTRALVLNPFNFVFRRSAYKEAANRFALNGYHNNTTNNGDNFYDFANSNGYGAENSRASFCRRPSLGNNRRRSIIYKIN